MPRTLFWRLTALLIGALALAVLAMVLVFRQDRAGLIARNFTDARIAQIESMRDALTRAAGEERGGRPFQLQMIAREYGIILIPVDRRPEIGEPPRGAGLQQLVERLQERLGKDVEVRLGRRLDQAIVWIRLKVGPDAPAASPETPGGLGGATVGPVSRAVWAGIPIRDVDSTEMPVRLTITLAVVLLALVAATFWFARRLARPLSDLANAVDKVALGKRPDPLPEDGPSEIARVARNVNRMAANLDRLERNRSTMLAGISHDIRTPLTRLRLASEMAVSDAQSRAEMAADIDEIDRVVTQFLDFARGTPKESPERADVQIALSAIADKANARELPVRWTAGAEALYVNTYPAAFERMLMNLIENAHRYGKPPVELTARRDGGSVEIDVLDAGDGVKPEDVERLKEPFVRGDHARGGAMGAGLGLALVERLAQWHGGSFDLLPRSGGGTVARLRLPLIH
ncbi:MAG: HAMP domain-containing protein [Burkholderiales bacterium]|nr:HAMP domain-containing protein [Burkholderiales bacterium]